MKSESNRLTLTPRCFCALPTIMEEECQGNVYKCQANKLNPPPENSQTDSDIQSMTGGHSGSLQRLINTRKDSKLSDHPSPETIAAIQDIASVLSSFGKTLGPRSPNLVKNGLKDSTNISVNHIQSQHSTAHTLSLKPKPIGVCGFHVHINTWEELKVQLCRAESVASGENFNRSQDPEREKIFAETHHQLVLRHRYLHRGFIGQALKDGCKAQMTTIAQWTEWDEGIVEQGFSWTGSSKSPSCFCRCPMKLSYLYNGQGPQMSYICTIRSQDIQRGCSRVLSSAKWAIRKKPQPRRDKSIALTDIKSESIWFQQTARNSIGSRGVSPITAFGSTLEHSHLSNDDLLRDIRQDSGIEVDENDAEGEDDGSEYDWDHSINLRLNISSNHRMRKLPMPAILVEKGSRAEELKSHRWSELRRGTSKETHDQWNEKQDHNHRQNLKRTNSDNNDKSVTSPTTSGRSTSSIRSLSVVQPKSISTLEEPKEYGPLIRRLNETKILTSERERNGKMAQSSETRLREWEESIKRLEEYVKELCQDGLSNSTLVCRSCGKGTFLQANVPCYHLVMCDDCIKKYQRCVVCSSKIESSQRIYW